MKNWLGEPATNNLEVGKNVKPRWGFLDEKLQLHLNLVYRKTMNGNQNNWICDMSTRGFLTEILLHKYNVEQTEVISSLLFLFWSEMFPKTFWNFFQSYDVTTLEIFI